MSEADGFKRVRGERVPGALSGARPKRKRGYHRALKRGEPWALLEDMMVRMSLKAFNEMLFKPLIFIPKN